MDEAEWEGIKNDTSNCTGFYTSHQKTVIFISVGSTGLVSISLCVVAIVLILWFKLHKNFAYRLASYQVITSMLISCTVVLATVPIIGRHYFVFCQIIGFFLEYFLWVKLLFVLCLIYHIFCLAVFFKNFKNLELCYIFVSFSVPLLFTWIPFVHRSYGLTESWCWIRDTECNGSRYIIGFIEQYVLWFAPLAVCIIGSFIAIIVILVAFKKRYNQVIETEEVSENNPLIHNPMKTYMLKVYFRKLLPMLIYPMVFFVLFLYPVIKPRQIHEALSSPVNFKLSIAHSICYASFGLFSSLLLIIHVLLVCRLKTWKEHFLLEDYVRPLNGSDASNDS